MSLNSKNIPLSGLSTSPSDYSVPDGHLSAAIGVVHEDGAIKNVVHTSPQELMDLSRVQICTGSASGGTCAISSCDVIYIHENNGLYKNIIVRGEFAGQKVYFYENVINGYPEEISFSMNSNQHFGDIHNYNVLKITSSGNTLIFYTDTEVYYYLWRNEQYDFVGSKIDDVELSFGLQSLMKRTEDGQPFVTILGYNIGEGERGRTNILWDNETKGNVSNAVYGALSMFVDESIKESKITQPHLITYAYRMYDGSFVSNSSPVLLIPSSQPPLVPIGKSKEVADVDGSEAEFTVLGFESNIDYKILNENAVSRLQNKWKDVVKSVCIFISSPFYTYDQTEQVSHLDFDFVPRKDRTHRRPSSDSSDDQTRAEETTEEPTTENNEWAKEMYGDFFTIASVDSSLLDDKRNKYTKIKAKELLTSPGIGRQDFDVRDFTFTSTSQITLSPVRFSVPKTDSFTMKNNIRRCSTFYLIKEIDISELSVDDSRTIIEFDGKTTLNGLQSREILSRVAYRYRDTIIPNVIANYNSRVNFADVKRFLYTGYNLMSMVCYQEPLTADDSSSATLYTLLNDNNDTYMTKSMVSYSVPKDILIPYLFYQDPDAKSFFLSFGSNTYKYPAREHEALDGAVYEDYLCENDHISITQNEQNSINDVSLYDKCILSPSMIYTSEAENPFVFRAENVEQVGNGRILALMPSAIALSEGQFGQFPMYCFTTDGIWALSVNETGGWAARQPVSRDVPITNKEGKPCILQLDRDIVFATDRGLMMLSGSKVSCISEIFDGSNDKWFDKYKSHLEMLLQKSDIAYSDNLFVPFRSYLLGGNMHYDYSHQRIIISNPNYPFCFVFGMKDRLWTAMTINVTSAINSYPESYAMATKSVDGKSCNVMIDFTKHVAAGEEGSNIPMPSDGYILTRPIKLGEPDVLKTIRSINLRGVFTESSRVNPSKDFKDHKFGMVLYGTNDPAMQSWSIVGSVKGPRMQFRYGSPYKAFRVAIISHMDENESLSHMEIVYETKETDKVR